MKSICVACIHNRTMKTSDCRQRRKGTQILACPYFKKTKVKREIGNSRKIAERLIGRRLGSQEMVHHINGNHYDDRPENILVCTFEEHYRIHSPATKNRPEIESRIRLRNQQMRPTYVCDASGSKASWEGY